MLDINAVLALLDGRSPRLDGRFAEQRCCLSAIVAAEIQYGLERRRVSEAVIRLIEGLLEAIEILPWSEACARPTGACGPSWSNGARPWRRWIC